MLRRALSRPLFGKVASVRHLTLALACTLGLAVLPAAAQNTAPGTTPGTRVTPPPVTAPAAKPATPPAATPDKPKDANPPAAVGNPVEYVKLVTSKGDIVLELDRAKAPLSVANFLAYVDKGFYDGTIFHRVIENFMIQGGGFTADLNQKPTDAAIKNEWQNGLKNNRGTIAMARTRMPDSATSQFYINVKDNPALDAPQGGAAYAVFGKVVVGMDVVDAIKAVQTTTKTATTPNGPAPFKDVPVEAVVITKATRITADEAKKLVKP